MNICYEQYYEHVFEDINGEKVAEKYDKKRIDKQYFKWKEYNNSFNNRINKSELEI